MDILSEQPDWLYLLREYHETFGAGSSGGSNAIRSHRRNSKGSRSAFVASRASPTSSVAYMGVRSPM